MASIHQAHVARFHAEMSAHAHHGGHDMYLFHAQWHQQNRDPRPPETPDRNWGRDLPFGNNFLQMHHEMVKAADNEPKQHMQHQSLVAWYDANEIALPGEWAPSQPIPAEIDYQPDVTVFPTAIRNAVQQWAQQSGVTANQWLTRETNHPNFTLPAWFTVEGVGEGEPGEPITGARKLSDFANANQLGCCLVFPHNSWHGRIGGAMGSTATAIADPIFYFGVHWHVDRVFDAFKVILAERAREPAALQPAAAAPPALAGAFTPAQSEWIAEQISLSERLNRPAWPPSDHQ